MTTDIPTLETSRLILRGHTREDFPAYAAMWADPVVTRFLGGAPHSEEDAWARYMRIAGHWAFLGFGFWCIVEKSSGLRIGEAGILDVKRAIEPSFHGTPEIGWALLPSAHGKGYATEAVRAILAWARNASGASGWCASSIRRTARRCAWAARCGFREYARTTYKGDPTIILERDP